MATPSAVLEPAEPEDLPGAWAVYLACTRPEEPAGCHQPAPDRPDLPPPLYAHLLLTSEGAFWVARHEDQVVGFAAAVTRGRLWWLSELWVAPGFRGRGIGSALLRKVRRASRGLRGRVLAGLTGLDGAGMVLGLRAGMWARYPVFTLEGGQEAVERLHRAHPMPPGARMARYDAAARLGPRSPLLRLDREVLAGTRPDDHVFWMTRGGRTCLLLWKGNRALAYAYLGTGGEVGPLAAAGPQGLLSALGLVVSKAARNSETVRLRIPGINHAALKAVLDAGFQVVADSQLMASEEFGHLERYLPGDESLF